jgi:hypothetical protein
VTCRAQTPYDLEVERPAPAVERASGGVTAALSPEIA